MNWRRGFIRFWIATSVLYLVVVMAMSGGLIVHAESKWPQPVSVDGAMPIGIRIANALESITQTGLLQQKALGTFLIVAVILFVPLTILWVGLSVGFLIVRGVRKDTT